MQIQYGVTESRQIEGVIVPKLVHGATLLSIDSRTTGVLECDALCTDDQSIRLGILTADCAPICFSDGVRIGIAHVGWRGLCRGLIEKMLTEFDSDTLEICVGPHLHTFEIQKDFCYDTISMKFGEEFFTHEEDRIIFHFKDAIASLLPKNVVFDLRNTSTDFSLPSYRRDKTLTRIYTIVGF